jgi:arsenate reductase (thioredoxin)
MLFVGLTLALSAELLGQTLAIPQPPARIVFVCEHGSVKSLVAMTQFNRRAQDLGLPYTAVARGTSPEASVPASVQEGLRSAGFNVSQFVPQVLTEADIKKASLIISFDQDLDALVGRKARYVKWDALPGVLANYTTGAEAIERRVESLIDELKRRAAPP